jgi:hypothetical protein
VWKKRPEVGYSYKGSYRQKKTATFKAAAKNKKKGNFLRLCFKVVMHDLA